VRNPPLASQVEPLLPCPVSPSRICPPVDDFLRTDPGAWEFAHFRISSGRAGACIEIGEIEMGNFGP